MIKRIKKFFQPSLEDIELAEQIRKLYETHDVTIRTNSWSGWSINVKRKTK